MKKKEIFILIALFCIWAIIPIMVFNTITYFSNIEYQNYSISSIDKHEYIKPICYGNLKKEIKYDATVCNDDLYTIDVDSFDLNQIGINTYLSSIEKNIIPIFIKNKGPNFEITYYEADRYYLSFECSKIDLQYINYDTNLRCTIGGRSVSLKIKSIEEETSDSFCIKTEYFPLYYLISEASAYITLYEYDNVYFIENVYLETNALNSNTSGNLNSYSFMKKNGSIVTISLVRFSDKYSIITSDNVLVSDVFTKY